MRLVLLGDPVEHCRSPAIHNAALAAAAIEGSYEALRVDRGGVATVVDQIRYGVLDGANVTMPHKEAAFTVVDRVSETALRAGAVNTVVKGEGIAVGENTDVSGILRVWKEAGIDSDAPVLVLGSGGAAAGALVALADHRVSISARSPQRARELLGRTRVDGDVVEWERGIDGAVVVNATPLGMAGEPLPHEVLEGSAGLIDFAYGNEPTPAVTAATGVGIPVADGLDVLVAQAADSFELWTGRPAPIPAMQAAVR